MSANHTVTASIAFLAAALASCGPPEVPRFAFPTDLPVGKVDSEPTGPNSWRVLHSKAPGIRLGNCATEDGGFLTQSCVNATSTQPPTPTSTATGSKTVTLDPDTTLGKDLNSGEFHYYSTLLSVNTTSNMSATVGAADVKIVHSTHRVVVEWTRYRTQSLPSGYQITSHPIINGLDIGIALRLIFDVQLDQQDANVAATFGFGQIAASIAAKQAQVSAHFEQRGTTFSFVPDTLITVSSVEDFIKALNAFYKSFTYMSSAWDAYVTGGEEAAVPVPPNDTPATGPTTPDGQPVNTPADPTAVTRATIVPVAKPAKANIFNGPLCCRAPMWRSFESLLDVRKQFPALLP